MKPKPPVKLPRATVHRLPKANYYLACLPCRTRKEARLIVRLRSFSEKDLDCAALAYAVVALKKSTNRRMLNANISFLVDHFITHPSPGLPPHLQSRLSRP